MIIFKYIIVYHDLEKEPSSLNCELKKNLRVWLKIQFQNMRTCGKKNRFGLIFVYFIIFPSINHLHMKTLIVPGNRQ